MDYNPMPPGFESAYNYVEGGFHPVNIGDTFNDRYRVLRKLGYGSHSTVWLVEDLSSNRYASLKILGAYSSSSTSELSVSRYLQAKQAQNVVHSGREHVIQIFDTFMIEDPNGTHHCIVTEFLGISLSSTVQTYYAESRRHFPEDITKRVAAQVALSVAYLHKCGIIHGDLHLSNVLFYSPKLQTASLDELDRFYGPPVLQPILYEDDTLVPPSPNLPKSAVSSDEMPSLFELCLSPVNDIHVKICDFGEATIIGSSDHIEKPFRSHMPRVFAAPEILFDDISSATTSIDIWALGVLLHMIINDKLPAFFSNRGIEKEVIEDMVIVLGKPPQKWWDKWPDRAEYSDENGDHLVEGLWSYEKGIRGIYGTNFSEEERESFARVLRKIFVYNPEERIDAEEVVRMLPRHWFNAQVLKMLDATVNGGVVSDAMTDADVGLEKSTHTIEDGVSVADETRDEESGEACVGTGNRVVASVVA